MTLSEGEKKARKKSQLQLLNIEWVHGEFLGRAREKKEFRTIETLPEISVHSDLK